MNINEFLTSNGCTSHLNKQEKADLLKNICDNYGLNPALLPFNFIAFQNQEKLYLTKNGCDQIANIRNLSRDIDAKDFDKDTLIYTITAKVSDSSRSESATACVFCGKYNDRKEIVRMTGLELANKLMSVETKAKRRATLAFIGFPYEEDAVADYETEIKKSNIAAKNQEIKQEVNQEIKQEVNQFTPLYDSSNNSHKMLIIKILKDVAQNETWLKNSTIVKEVAEFSKSLHNSPFAEVEKKTLIKGAYIFEYFNRENKIHLEIFHSIFDDEKTKNSDVKEYLETTSGTKEDITTLFQDFHKKIPVNRIRANMCRYCYDYVNAVLKEQR